MKLFFKILFSAVLVLAAVLCFVEYYMVSGTFERSLSREVDYELDQYRFMRMTVYLRGVEAAGEQLGERFMLITGDAYGPYSDFPEGWEAASASMDTSEGLSYRIREADGRQVLFVSGILPGGSVMTTGREISQLYEERLQMEREYSLAIYLAMGACILCMALVSYFLVKPIRRLGASAERIARGEYGERAPEKGRDEVGELARSFNKMAEAVEQTVEELSEEARRKERFMGDFSHEIKTPMTAIIGYADSLYQKEYSREEVREAASYILNEGMRLETLSQKMLRFIALEQEDFCLEQVPAAEFFQDIRETLRPLIKREQGLKLFIRFRPGELFIEWDLMKTLVLNLIDNARKAGGTAILLKGERDGRGYQITVNDNGRGIPAESLPHIQDPFYMVDKSRSRKQNGAGLGLALCKKIAALHHTVLEYRSREGAGTTVTIRIPGREEGEQ